LSEQLIRCPFCDVGVRKERLAQHQRTNVKCQKIRRVNDLVDRHFVLVHKNSPIYSWATTYLRDTPIWEYDMDDEAFLPSWFCEMWFRAEKSPVTGRLVCSTQSFLESVQSTMKSERRQGALAVQSRLRDVGYFGHAGGIYKSDCKTPVWLPPNGDPLKSARNGEFNQEDFRRMEGTMIGQREPFQHTRYFGRK
jgi:hypothetical protein